MMIVMLSQDIIWSHSKEHGQEPSTYLAQCNSTEDILELRLKIAWQSNVEHGNIKFENEIKKINSRPCPCKALT